jgi:hypothetical protein
LHSILFKIDDKYDPSYRNAEDAKKMPALSAWMKKHALILPYSISIRKCNDVSCCGKLRSPVASRDLVMQRQPTPRIDTSNTQRENHFLSRDQSLLLFANNASAESDLTDLPSKKVNDLKEANKVKATRDKEMAEKLQLRSWDVKKVRSFVFCFNCNKPRCIFSKELNTAYYQAANELKKKMEFISGYSCGDLLFDDDHEISTVIAQRQQLTCESRVEVAYYNVDGRSFKTTPVCIYCGKTGRSSFLYQQAEIEARNKSEGKKCYPICIDCFDEGKKVVHYAKSKTNEQIKRKEDAANKSAAASARSEKN